MQSTAVQDNWATKHGTIQSPLVGGLVNVTGDVRVEDALTQVPGSESSIKIADGGAPTLTVRWINHWKYGDPKQKHQVAPSYVLSSPRWVTYKKQVASSQMIGSYTFRWNQIKLSSLPPTGIHRHDDYFLQTEMPK